MTTIALVDDQQSILTSVSLALEAEGYKVDTFSNGIDALQGLETNTRSAKRLESSLNQTLLIVNNGFSDMRKKQEMHSENISESYSSIHDELIKLETGLLIFHLYLIFAGLLFVL